MTSLRRLGLLAAALLLTACAAVPPAPPALERADAAAQSCAAWFAKLDEAIDTAGVRDAGTHRVAGHPYLRADRFTASLREEAQRSAAAFDAWAQRLRALDRVARQAELRTLGPAGLQALAATPEDALRQVDQCGQTLARADLATPEGRERLRQLARVPDDYAAWVRSTGIYALARIPFSFGVAGWHRDAEAMFRDAATRETPARQLRHVDPAGAEVSAAQVRDVMQRAPRDALGVPLLSPQDEALLFRAYAPRYEIETTGAHDHFGALAWGDGVAPRVDTNRPVVYRRLAHTRFQGRMLVQLVYTLWFPERPRAHALDLLGGTLDGLVMRVTLGEDGTPLVWDSIHPCGCYHLFFPTAALKELAAPDPRDEWVLIPARLPRMGVAERVAVRTATSTHYLVAIAPAEPGPAAAASYTLADEDELRALPLPGGGWRSLYGPDALVRGSERPERLFFWPMGIASPGTMRQWGRHPTAFLGRRHFDDADLIDLRFAPATPGVTANAADAAADARRQP